VCEDDGQGMGKLSFREYHNLGSLTKNKTTGTIGFAGIGAKLCIDLCDFIYTETNESGDLLASKWWFKDHDMEPTYKFVAPSRLLKNRTGTYVKIEKLRAFKMDFVELKRLILEHFEYSLKPFGDLSIFINDTEILGSKPDENIYQNEIINKKLRKTKSVGRALKISGQFFFVDDEYIKNCTKRKGVYAFSNKKENFSCGTNIVVCGKTILKGEFFNLIPQINPGHHGYVTGFLRCDELVEITKTSKDDLNKRTAIWRHFAKTSALIFENWLKEIGEWYEPQRKKKDHVVNIVEVIEKHVNLIINQFPELLQSFSFPSKLKKKTPIEDTTGSLLGSETDIGQLSTGTIGGETTGSEEKIPTAGFDENEKGVKVNPEGDKRIKTPRKRVRGPSITLVTDPERKDVAWFIPSVGAFAINEAHPAFVLASDDPPSLDTYITYVLFTYILEIQEEIGINEKKNYLWKLYETYLSTPT